MKLATSVLIVILILFIFCLGQACERKRPVHRNHTVEFRLSETQMGEGLIEQIVTNSDEKVYLHKESIITADDIDDAQATPGITGAYQVNIHFTSDGAKRMEKATSENISKRMAIVIDGRVLSAPTIQSTISSDCNIVGNFTKESAENVAKIINED